MRKLQQLLYIMLVDNIEYKSLVMYTLDIKIHNYRKFLLTSFQKMNQDTLERKIHLIRMILQDNNKNHLSN